MIDHVSIGVHDLAQATRFHEVVLGAGLPSREPLPPIMARRWLESSVELPQ